MKEFGFLNSGTTDLTRTVKVKAPAVQSASGTKYCDSNEVTASVTVKPAPAGTGEVVTVRAKAVPLDQYRIWFSDSEEAVLQLKVAPDETP